MKLLYQFFVFITVSSVFALDPKPNIAVSDFCGQGGLDSSKAVLFSERFQAELMNTNAFQVLDRKQMGSILQEQGFQQSGACSGEDCTVKIGQLLGVDKMFAGCVSEVEGLITLNVRRIDVQTGKIEAQYVVDSKDGLQGALTESCRIMANKFTGNQSEKKSSHLWWWIGGGVVAAGGIATAVLLLTQDNETKTVNNPRKY